MRSLAIAILECASNQCQSEVLESSTYPSTSVGVDAANPIAARTHRKTQLGGSCLFSAKTSQCQQGTPACVLMLPPALLAAGPQPEPAVLPLGSPRATQLEPLGEQQVRHGSAAMLLLARDRIYV
jgi:hypothetical protein